jgi:hypothetical protein
LTQIIERRVTSESMDNTFDVCWRVKVPKWNSFGPGKAFESTVFQHSAGGASWRWIARVYPKGSPTINSSIRESDAMSVFLVAVQAGDEEAAWTRSVEFSIALEWTASDGFLRTLVHGQTKHNYSMFEGEFGWPNFFRSSLLGSYYRDEPLELILSIRALESPPLRAEKKQLKLFHDFYHDEILADFNLEITTASHVQCFKLHSLVLATQAEYFRRLFESNFFESKQHSISVSFEQVDMRAVRRCIQWFYTGSYRLEKPLEKPLDVEELLDLITVSAYFGIGKLTRKLEAELGKHISFSDIVIFWTFSNDYGLQELQKLIIIWIRNHQNDIRQRHQDLLDSIEDAEKEEEEGSMTQLVRTIVSVLQPDPIKPEPSSDVPVEQVVHHPVEDVALNQIEQAVDNIEVNMTQTNQLLQAAEVLAANPASLRTRILRGLRSFLERLE